MNTKKQWVAVTCAVLLPGAGHLYAGERRRGLLLIASWATVAWAGLAGHSGYVWIPFLMLADVIGSIEALRRRAATASRGTASAWLRDHAAFVGPVIAACVLTNVLNTARVGANDAVAVLCAKHEACFPGAWPNCAESVERFGVMASGTVMECAACVERSSCSDIVLCPCEACIEDFPGSSAKGLLRPCATEDPSIRPAGLRDDEFTDSGLSGDTQ